MVKAEDFWNYLCDKLDYRFFSGVVCPGLLPLYKKMHPDKMHYIPAVNEKIGLGLVSGAYMAGFKGGLLMDMRFSYELVNFLRFTVENKIPFIIIGYSEHDVLLPYDLPITFIKTSKFTNKVNCIIKESEELNVPGFIVFKEGILV
jgi:hypothetical protein